MSWKILWVLVIVGSLSLAFSSPDLLVSAEPSTKWTKTFDSGGDDEAYSVKVGDNGYILAGRTNLDTFGRYDAWLIKTDSHGEVQWNRNYGGLFNDRAHSLVATVDGGYAFAGSTNSYGAGNADVWLVRVDNNGDMLWNKTYGGSLDDHSWSLVVTGDGGFALLCDTTSYGSGGSDVWLIKVDSSGDIEWNQTYGGNDFESVSTIIRTNDGGYAFAASTTSFGAGSSDFWLVKLDSYGNVEWNQTYGGSGVEFANSLVETVDGGYALAGSTSALVAGNADVWFVKVDSFGNMEWNKTYGGPIADYCDSIVTSCNGDYTLACVSQPPVRTLTPPFGDGVFWLFTIDCLGGLELNQTYGVSAHHSHTSLLVADGSYIFGGSTRDNAGYRDFWLVKIGESQIEQEVIIYILIPILVVVVLIILLIYKRNKNSKI
jgi:predicted secreted protein